METTITMSLDKYNKLELKIKEAEKWAAYHKAIINELVRSHPTITDLINNLKTQPPI